MVTMDAVDAVGIDDLFPRLCIDAVTGQHEY
jgi:hypothetical protein